MSRKLIEMSETSPMLPSRSMAEDLPLAVDTTVSVIADDDYLMAGEKVGTDSTVAMVENATVVAWTVMSAKNRPTFGLVKGACS